MVRSEWVKGEYLWLEQHGNKGREAGGCLISSSNSRRPARDERYLNAKAIKLWLFNFFQQEFSSLVIYFMFQNT